MLDTPTFPAVLPSLASIRAFEAAARHGNFARAAAELGMTPASVSYHVRQLEKQIGMSLFERHAQRVTLTPSGAAIAPEATKFFSSLRATFVSAVDAFQSRLSLTALPTIGSSWLAPRLGRFRASHPDVAVEVDLSEIAEPLGTGKFDAAIRNGHGDWPGLRAHYLFPSVFMPLCAPALKEAARAIADPSKKLDAPLLGRPDWWARWYAALGMKNADLAGRFGTTFNAEYLDSAAAIAGQGIAIGSPILFADDIKAGRLVPAHDLVAADGRHFWFVYPVARGDTAKVATFRDWLLTEAEQAREAGERHLKMRGWCEAPKAPRSVSDPAIRRRGPAP
jgi:LysR family glycine cleavage system transcriptional activator